MYGLLNTLNTIKVVWAGVLGIMGLTIVAGFAQSGEIIHDAEQVILQEQFGE